MRRAARVLLLLVLGLLGLACLALIGAQIALEFPAVRAEVEQHTEALVSDALGAQLQIGELEAVSLTGQVRASNVRLHSRAGERLASIEQLSARLDPLALLTGQVRLSRLRLEQPFVDLGTPADEDPGGLLGLFTNGEPEPAPEEAGGLEVALEQIEIEGGRALARIDGQVWTASSVDAAGEVAVADGVRVEVERANARVARAGRKLAELRELAGSYGPDGAVSAEATVVRGKTRVVAHATLGAEGADPRAVELSAEATEITSQTLSAFGLHTHALTAPVDLALRARGDTSALNYELQLDTPGGELDAHGRIAQDGALSAELNTGGLRPSRFLRAEVGPLAGNLRLRAEPAPEFPNATVRAELSAARYAGMVLPHTTIDARVRPERGIVFERVVASYDDTRVVAKGRLDADTSLSFEAEIDSQALGRVPPLQAIAKELSGALHATVRGEREPGGELQITTSARLPHAAYGPVSARALEVQGNITGTDPERLRVQLDATASKLTIAGRELERVSLDIEGGPRRYDARVRIPGRGGLRARVVRTDTGAITLRGRGRVALDPGDFVTARLGQVTLTPKGAIELERVRLQYRGARAFASGVLDPDGRSDLSARIVSGNLARVTRPWLKQPIPGRLELTADLEGKTKQPHVRVNAAYATRDLLGIDPLAVELTAHANLKARTLALDADATTGAGALEVRATSDLARGPLSVATLARSEYQVALRAKDVPLHELELWPEARPVPQLARVSGDVQAEGTLQSFDARFHLRSLLRFPRDPDAVAVALRGRYSDSDLALELQAEDRKGLLMRSRVRTELAASGFLAPPPDPLEALQKNAWEVSLWVGSRRIEDWPAVRALEVHPGLMPAEVAAHVDLEHVPGEEPAGELRVRATWRPAGAKSESPQCGLANPIRMVLEADMEDGRLQAQARGSLDGATVVTAEATSHAPIDEWFDPEPVRIRPVSLSAQFAGLNFAEVPVACETLGGRVAGSVRVSRALSEKVVARAYLTASRLRIGDGPRLAARVSASADHDSVLLFAQVAGPEDSSATLHGRLPLDPGGRLPSIDLDAPASARVQLDDIDASALFAAVPMVAARGGTLGGALTVEGSVRDPQIKGQLQLSDVGVTLPTLGQRFDRVQGELRLSGRTLYIERLRLRDRGGSAKVSGEITMRDLESFRAQLRAETDDFPIRRSGVMLARLDGDLELRAEVVQNRTELWVALRDASVELTGESLAGVQPLDPLPDIVFLDERAEDVEIEEAEAEDERVTVVHFEAEAFWIRRNDFSAYVRPDLRIEVRDDTPNVRGVVEIERGVIQLVGQLFDIERGRIEFPGGQETAPFLNLVATRRAPGGASVTVQAQGPVADPTLTFLVDGEAVTAGEALAAAAGTRMGEGRDSSVQQQIGSFATGIATGVLTLGAREQLGEWLPVFAIERGGEGQTRLRAGVEADRLVPKFLRGLVVDAYLEGSVSTPPSEEDDAIEPEAPGPEANVLLELRFPHDLVGAAQYGSQRWSIDITWEP